MNSFTSVRRPLVALLTLLLAGAALTAVASPAHAAVTEGIAGTVSTAGEGGPFTGAWVHVEPVAIGGTRRDAVTEADGTFAVSVPPGEYWVRISSYTAGAQWAPEWWGNSVTRGGSTKVVVTAGSVSTIAPVLEPGGTLSGSFASAAKPGNGAAIGFVDVFVADPSLPGGDLLVGGAAVDGAGAWTAKNLPPGDLRVRFRNTSTKVEGWWNDSTTRAGATPVAVTSGSTTSGIDAKTLVAFGRISGTLTDATNHAPVAGTAYVFRLNEYGAWDQPITGYSAYSASDGTYDVDVPAGTYRVAAGGSSYAYAYYDHATNIPTAQDLVVAPSGTTSGIDLELAANNVNSNTPPGIEGGNRVGMTLTGFTGSWSPSSAVITRQWLRDGVPIPGAVHSQYYLRPADAGHEISLQVRGTITMTSPPQSIYQTVETAPRRIYLGILGIDWPAIHGTFAVDNRLRVGTGMTLPNGHTTRWRWLREGAPIPGATGSSYLLAPADRGKHVGVRITISRPGYRTEVRTLVRSTVVR